MAAAAPLAHRQPRVRRAHGGEDAAELVQVRFAGEEGAQAPDLAHHAPRRPHVHLRQTLTPRAVDKSGQICKEKSNLWAIAA